MFLKVMISAVMLSLCWQNLTQAAPPEVTSLFPAGTERGASVKVTIQGKLGEGANEVWTSRRGVQVQFGDKAGPLTVSVAPDVEPGICWMRFFNSEGSTSLRPFIIGAFREAIEQEPNDDVVAGQPLPSLPVVMNGQHGKNGDTDSFAVSLRKGQVVVASLMANRTLGSPQDAVLQILGPDGFVLEQNEDDQGFDPFLVYTAAADGIYTLRTWAFPATPDSSIRLYGNPACVYRLLVTTGPYIDHVMPQSVQAGQSERLHLFGWNLTQTQQEVQSPVSALGRTYRWPVDGWINHIPVTVLAQPWKSIVETEPNPLAEPQSVELPMTVSGAINHSRDVDAYQFQASKGSRWKIELIARDAGSPLDPVVRVYDSAGKLLKEADDDGKQSPDPDFEFTAPADDRYRVTVTDRFLHFGERFTYLLSIVEPTADFSLSVSTDSFVLQPDKELEIPVTVNRSGMTDVIQIEAHGLPDGVTASAVTSEPKGDSAKSVKLKLKSNDQTKFSGPVRIVGRPLNSVMNERTATVSLKAFQSDLPYLWLTVKPK